MDQLRAKIKEPGEAVRIGKLTRMARGAEIMNRNRCSVFHRRECTVRVVLCNNFITATNARDFLIRQRYVTR